MTILFDNIKRDPFENEEEFLTRISGELDIDDSLEVDRRSLDSRDKSNIRFVYRLQATLPPAKEESFIRRGMARPLVTPEFSPTEKIKGKEVIIVGMGPAGIFAALRLLEREARVILVERGRPVEERMRDILSLEEKSILNRESNVLFGEGGAGAYSDGKLTTRTKYPEQAWLNNQLLRFGVDPDVLVDAHPHIGTDRLTNLLKRIRFHLQSRGVSIHFHSRVRDILLSSGKVRGVHLENGDSIESEAVILAPGHSSRDLIYNLQGQSVPMEKKGFAVGLRVEHPSDLIKHIQYGEKYPHDLLPAAEYRLAWNNRLTGRGVYSFCMCPGGRIVNSSSEPERICINGMSYSSRGLPRSNAALVVTIGPHDIPAGPLAGIEFQRKLEETFFSLGGGNFHVPVQSIPSFLAGLIDKQNPPSSYKPGSTPADLYSFLPAYIGDEIRNGLKAFDQKMKGFITDEGILHGIETRTSSPLRILRNKTGESPGFPGLYPAGEGAGYAGGIVSSAVDGIRAADRIT